MKVLKVSKKCVYGKLLEVLTPAEERVRVKCKAFTKCGGCQLQHLRYSSQLSTKENNIKTCFSKIANLKVEGKTLIVLPENNQNVQASSRNIEGVKTSLTNTINVYDLLKYNKLVLTVDTVKKLEEVYA